MGEKVPQTFANHTRYDPLFHFFLTPVALALLVWAIAHLIRHTSNEAVAWVVASLLLFLAIFKTRLYALKVQDRIIRLEERLRLANLAPNVPSDGFKESQLTALRFASDAELPSLAQKAASGNLDSKQIKQAVQSWRPDYWRV